MARVTTLFLSGTKPQSSCHFTKWLIPALRNIAKNPNITTQGRTLRHRRLAGYGENRYWKLFVDCWKPKARPGNGCRCTPASLSPVTCLLCVSLSLPFSLTLERLLGKHWTTTWNFPHTCYPHSHSNIRGKQLRPLSPLFLFQNSDDSAYRFLLLERLDFVVGW